MAKNKVGKHEKIPRWYKELIINQKNPKITEVLLSRERTLLSKKRIIHSQINIGIALAALGFALMRFFETSRLNNMMLFISLVLIFISLTIISYSIRGNKKYNKKLNRLKRFRGHLDNLYFIELLEKN